MFRAVRFVLAILVCAISLALPYRARVVWFSWLAWIAHLPYVAFGKLARFILSQTQGKSPSNTTRVEK